MISDNSINLEKSGLVGQALQIAKKLNLDSDLTMELVRLRAKNRELEANLLSKGAELQSIEASQKSMDELYNSLSDELVFEQSKSKLALDSIASLQSRIKELQASKQSLGNRLKRQSSNNEEMKALHLNQEDKISALKNEIKQLKNLEKDNKSLKNEVQDLKSAIEEKDKTVEYLSEEVAKLHNRLNEALDQFENSQFELSQFKRDRLAVEEKIVSENIETTENVEEQEKTEFENVLGENLIVQVETEKVKKKVRFSDTESENSQLSVLSSKSKEESKHVSLNDLENFCVQYSNFEFQGIGFDVNQVPLSKLTYYKSHLVRENFYKLLRLSSETVSEENLLRSFEAFVGTGNKNIQINKLYAEAFLVLKNKHLKSKYDLLLRNIHLLKNGFACNVLYTKSSSKGVRITKKERFVKFAIQQGKNIHRLYLMKIKGETVRRNTPFYDLKQVLSVGTAFKLSLNPERSNILNGAVLFGGKQNMSGVSLQQKETRLNGILELRWRDKDLMLDLELPELVSDLVYTLTTLYLN
eukprot:maker-scaffold_2-snap-gene-5.67-mRNA-1 protein AED:0.00 eAED:0.00 QI:213/1/1/1/1/1/2/182/527